MASRATAGLLEMGHMGLTPGDVVARRVTLSPGARKVRLHSICLAPHVSVTYDHHRRGQSND